MKTQILAVILATVATLGTGCGTVSSHIAKGISHDLFGRDYRLGIYPGVRKDVQVVCHAPVAPLDEQPIALCFGAFCIADIPVSGVADTCMLPWDIKEM